jgi:hypothetical protein
MQCTKALYFTPELSYVLGYYIITIKLQSHWKHVQTYSVKSLDHSATTWRGVWILSTQLWLPTANKTSPRLLIRNYMAGGLNPINTTMTTNGKQNKPEATYTSTPLLSIQNTEGDPHPFANSKERVSTRQTTWRLESSLRACSKSIVAPKQKTKEQIESNYSPETRPNCKKWIPLENPTPSDSDIGSRKSRSRISSPTTL